MKARCPKHNYNTTFSAIANTHQTWEVDSNGNFIRVIKDPNYYNGVVLQNDLWICQKCGKIAILESTTEYPDTDDVKDEGYWKQKLEDGYQL
jgi:hypothetical protein